MKELANKQIALKMLDEAEKLKALSNQYKIANELDRSQLSPMITPENLFGISKEEKSEQYQKIIDQLEADKKDMFEKAKKCI